jgi:hypothetical protein
LDEDDEGNRVYVAARGFRGQPMIFVIHWADTRVTDIFWSWEECEAALDANHKNLLAAIAVEALKRLGH